MGYRVFGLWALLTVVAIPELTLAGEVRVEVPFRLCRDYAIVVEGAIGPLEKLHFLLDTGAVPSVIDRRVAKRLRLTGSKQRLSVFSKNIRARRVILPDLRVGPVSVISVPVLVQDLSFVEEGLGVRVDGMIGLDILGRASFTIDYSAKKLAFGPAETLGSPHALQSGPGFVYLTIQVQSQPLYLVVDTGAKDLVLLATRVASQLNALQTQGTKASSNMGGTVYLKEVQLPEARLGTTELGTLNAFLLESQSGGNPGFDGLLGIRSLGVTRVAFDFERQTISWQ